MNERIRLLAKQANDYAESKLDDGYAYDEIHFFYEQKFAELIVAECQEVVRWAISVDSTIDRVPVLIKEHFGVEK